MKPRRGLVVDATGSAVRGRRHELNELPYDARRLCDDMAERGFLTK